MKRLGGESEIPVDLLSAAPRADAWAPPPGRAAVYVDSGRSALSLAAESAKGSLGRAHAWLPRYCCESVIEPFRRAGFKLDFYGTGRDLTSPSGLPRSLSGSVFLYIHYFGRRNVELESFVADCRRSGDEMIVVEDCVQAPLTAGLGGVGDHAVFGFRKVLPLPDGAALVSNRPIEGAVGESDEDVVSRRLLGKLLRGAGGRDEDFLRLFAEAEERLDAGSPRAMSWLSRRLLAAMDVRAEGTARRANGVRLSAALARVFPADGGPLFPAPAEGEIPLGLPVFVPGGRRDALRAYLARKRVYCAVHWPLPAGPAGFEAEKSLADSILTLPLGPSASVSDMDELAAEIRSFFGGAA